MTRDKQKRLREFPILRPLSGEGKGAARMAIGGVPNKPCKQDRHSRQCSEEDKPHHNLENTEQRLRRFAFGYSGMSFGGLFLGLY